MNKQTIEYTIMFLNRTDLKGSEVPAFNLVMSELEKEYNFWDKKGDMKPEVKSEQEEDLTDEDFEDQEGEEEPEPEITEKDIKKEKKKVEDLMKEIDEL